MCIHVHACICVCGWVSGWGRRKISLQYENVHPEILFIRMLSSVISKGKIKMDVKWILGLSVTIVL